MRIVMQCQLQPISWASETMFCIAYEHILIIIEAFVCLIINCHVIVSSSYAQQTTLNFVFHYNFCILLVVICWCFACFQTLNESNHISISSNPFHLEFINQLIAMKNWLIRLVYSESFECDLRFWFHCSMRWICISAENYNRWWLVVDYFGAKTNRMFDVIVESL